mmetsp:Transcript_101927/g.287657  ORF Transcript_101927/g.287657 Transcript_101927/m.287657 type:complete len:232 (+) Transcript_101927:1805-2500(+)
MQESATLELVGDRGCGGVGMEPLQLVGLGAMPKSPWPWTSAGGSTRRSSRACALEGTDAWARATDRPLSCVSNLWIRTATFSKKLAMLSGSGGNDGTNVDDAGSSGALNAEAAVACNRRWLRGADADAGSGGASTTSCPHGLSTALANGAPALAFRARHVVEAAGTFASPRPIDARSWPCRRLKRSSRRCSLTCWSPRVATTLLVRVGGIGSERTCTSSAGGEQREVEPSK